MDRDELIAFLKEHLSITVEEDRGYYGDTSIEVHLKLFGETISYGSAGVSNNCRCSCGSND